MSVYQARTEDYNEGEGLEWGEAEERVEDDFKDWAKEYINTKKAKKSLTKQNKKTGINLDI